MLFYKCTNAHWIQTENKSREDAKRDTGVRQGHIFSLDLFNVYNESIIRELDTLSEFMISGHNLNISYANDTVLMVDTERKLQNLLDRLVKECYVSHKWIYCKQCFGSCITKNKINFFSDMCVHIFAILLSLIEHLNKLI